jgi:hypothetical protein
MPASVTVDQAQRESSLTARRALEPARDIARGGLAGLVTGIVVAGAGGRIVMRLATLLVPDAVGQLTENGNVIGDITLGGTLGLVVGGGLFFGLSGSVVWIVVRQWIPGGRRTRVLLAAPVAVALTGIALIDGFNPDFLILRHDAVVVGLLVALVAVAGMAISLCDSWLDRRLPAVGRSPTADSAYLILTLLGAVLIVPLVLAAYLGGHDRAVGLALFAVGVATLVAWVFRYRAMAEPWWLVAWGRGALLIAVAVGFLALGDDVGRALDLP